MPRCWLSIGSNQDREASIRGAIVDLRSAFGDLVLSRVYESAAEGFAGESFLHLVAGIDTDKTVAEIDRILRAIEAAHGRLRGPDKFAPRTLDIDLLTYGQAVGNLDGRDLPRDEILRYAFVLAPLAEVAQDEVHPGSGRTYRDLFRELIPKLARAGQAPVVVGCDLARPAPQVFAHSGIEHF
jgi:2-amino-4-hydroxy-6-hydroxymethyldihydropteridine diphosphokinase